VVSKKRRLSTCGTCRNEIKLNDDFCPHCGSILTEGLTCSKHRTQKAEGVCIVCSAPYCGKCGAKVHKLFLCSTHQEYEIYEGMARVYGVSDEANAKYVADCLKKSRLHPFVYLRKVSPLSVGGPDHTNFRASGEFDGHIINEVKVLVPCHEVTKAEALLARLEVKSSDRKRKKRSRRIER